MKWYQHIVPLGHCLFEITTGHVTFKTISFDLSMDESSIIDTPLITATGGAFELIAVTITSASPLATISPMLVVSGSAPASIKGCVFENLSLSSAATTPHGAAIWVSVPDNAHTFSLTNSMFTSCLALNGGAVYSAFGESATATLKNVTFTQCAASQNGGGVYATLAPRAKLTLGGSSGAENVTSTECASPESGGCIYATLTPDDSIISFPHTHFEPIDSELPNGAFVYIACPHGFASASASEWTSLGEYSSLTPNTNYCWVNETDGTGVSTDDGEVKHPQSTSLLHFLYPPSDDSDVMSMYVAVSGLDVDMCGWSDLPCLTLTTAFTQKGASVTSISLSAGAYALLPSDSFTLSQSFSIVRTRDDAASTSLTVYPSEGTASFIIDTSTTHTLLTSYGDSSDEAEDVSGVEISTLSFSLLLSQ